MDGDNRLLAKSRWHRFSPITEHSDCRAEQRLGGGPAEGDKDSRFQYVQFGRQPRTAGADLPGVWLLVQPAFASGLPFEVLHHICDIDVFPFDADFEEGTIQKMSGRPHERPPFAIFHIPRLFTYQDDFGVSAAFAEDGLSGGSVEGTRAAPGRGLA